MGADIHFYVEKKQADGSWELQGRFEREVEDEGTDDEYVWMGQVDRPMYSGRNYNLFAILADVRNGRGFAGIKTGEGFNPISDPRGVPDDASQGYIELVDQYGCDGHSHSYHTLRQILDFDWTQTTECQGWCSMSNYLPWATRGVKDEGPASYGSAVGGVAVTHLTDDEANKLVDQYKSMGWEDRQSFIDKQQGVYALAKWNPTYHYCAGSFVNSTIPKLLALAGGTSGLDDVRIVFFFDN